MLLLNKRFYKSKNLLIITLATFVVIPTLILFLYIYIKNIQFLNEKLETNTLVFTEQLNYNLSSNIEELTSFLNMTANDPLVLNSLVETRFSEKGYERKKTYDSLTSFFSNMSRYNHSNLYNVLLVPQAQEGYYFYRTYNAMEKDNLHEQNWYQEAAAIKGKINWIGVIPANNNTLNDKVLAVSKAVINKQTYEVSGVLYFEFSLQNFDLFSNPDLDHQFLAVRDQNGEYIYKTTGFENLLSTENALSKAVANDYSELPTRKYLVTSAGIPESEWEVLNIVLKATYSHEIVRVGIISGLLLIVCLFIYSIYLGILQKNFTTPLQSLVNLFNEIESGNPNLDFKQFSCYEMLKLTNGAITLIEKKKNADKELKSSLEKQDMLNMNMLRAKMNPHFIYNVLNTVKYRALTHGQQDIANILNSLIKLLKGSISRNGTYCTLEEELGLILDYVTIQQEIYGHLILVEEEIAEGAGKCILPAMLLQPLVENSILHGFDMQADYNTIIIYAEKRENILIIKVRDNGSGMPYQKVIKLQNYKEHQMSNVGLPGVIERVRLIYGTQGKVKVESTPGDGTTIEINIPVMHGEKEEV